MISDPLRDRVRKSADHRCGYCLTHQRYAMQVLEIEHIVPRASGGTDDEEICGWPVDSAIVPKGFKPRVLIL